jgi:SAM-dependent methyltransferase
LQPLTLNLGSGKDWRDDCLNADIQARVKPDWEVDISKVRYGAVVQTRFGEVEIKPEMFDKIIANDVLEHIPDLVGAMTNCKTLLKPGGEFHIHVPYELSLGAWQDPTHVRAFNENSWLYYTDWHWYLGWEDRFHLKQMAFNLSEYGNELAEKKLTDAEILRTPRAVDSMSVILCKQS